MKESHSIVTYIRKEYVDLRLRMHSICGLRNEPYLINHLINLEYTSELVSVFSTYYLQWRRGAGRPGRGRRCLVWLRRARDLTRTKESNITYISKGGDVLVWLQRVWECVL